MPLPSWRLVSIETHPAVPMGATIDGNMEDDREELPEPTSGLFLEVSFRRLLASCESIVDGTSTARPDLIDKWRRSPVFHHVGAHCLPLPPPHQTAC